MKRSTKVITTVILLATLLATALLTLSGCTLILLASIRSFDVVVDGVHFNVNTEMQEATVYYFDADETLEEGELQVCVIPETVRFRKKDYPVTKIRDHAEYEGIYYIINGDAQIGELVVPSTVEYIQLYGYQDIGSLQQITVDEQNPYYYSKDGVLFRNYGSDYQLAYYPLGKTDETFEFPAQFRTIDNMSGVWDNQYVQSFEVEQDNTKYTAINGALYSKDGEELMLYPSYRVDNTFVAPKGMKRFNPNCHLWDNRYVTNVDVAEDSLYLKVEDNALYSKDGSELVLRPDDGRVCFAIPSTVKVVSYNAFNGVDYLFVPKSVVVFLDVLVDRDYNLTGIEHIYFEDEILPRYLLGVQFAQTQLRFSVSRESFQAFADIM